MTSMRGSGDLFFDAEANLDAYINYQLSTGSSLETYTFQTTRQQEQLITQNADSQGGASPGFCSKQTSTALDGVPPFQGLGTFYLPGNLAEALRRIPGVVQRVVK